MPYAEVPVDPLKTVAVYEEQKSIRQTDRHTDIIGFIYDWCCL